MFTLKNYPSYFLFLIALIIFPGCKSYYSVLTYGEQIGQSTVQGMIENGKACPNPTYVATLSKSVQEVRTEGVFYNQEELTLVSLLRDAKKVYGDDVTIQNIRWDLRDGREKTGAIFDVVKCK